VLVADLQALAGEPPGFLPLPSVDVVHAQVDEAVEVAARGAALAPLRLMVAGSGSLGSVMASASKSPSALAAVRAGSDSVLAVSDKTAGAAASWSSAW
jgi:hypothetical protein